MFCADLTNTSRGVSRADWTHSITSHRLDHGLKTAIWPLPWRLERSSLQSLVSNGSNKHDPDETTHEDEHSDGAIMNGPASFPHRARRAVNCLWSRTSFNFRPARKLPGSHGTMRNS